MLEEELAQLVECAIPVRNLVLVCQVHLGVPVCGPHFGREPSFLTTAWSRSERAAERDSRQAVPFFRFKDGVPAKVARPPCRDNLALCPALKEDGFGTRTGRVGERADGGGALGGETREHVVQACVREAGFVGDQIGAILGDGS